MKLTALGGGGVRSTFLTKSPAYNAHRTGLTEMVFLDNSADNLAIFGEVTRYVFNAICPDIQFSTATDPVMALQDTNYIITTLRVDGDESRIRDGCIVLQHNALGQKTTDIGGFTMVMRSIPAIFRYCRLIEEHIAENAILSNFTNPSGLVTEVIVKSGFKHRVYGIYDAPPELIRELPAVLGCEERDPSVECYRLDHFSWFTHLAVRGEEVTERLVASPELYQKTTTQYLSSELARLCDNQLLDEYLYYHYYRKVVLKATQEVGEARGEQITRINQEMREALRTVNVRTRPKAALIIWMQHYLRRENNCMQNESQQEKFHTREPLTPHQSIEEPDTSGYTEAMLDILETVNSTTTECIVVSIQNHDTLDFLCPDDMIEISCDLSWDSLKPVTPVRMPTARRSIISCVKEYERLAVAAVLQQDKSLAVRAPVAHLLIGSYSLAKTPVEAHPDDKQFATWQ